jgi:hypothetical protein
VSGATCVEGRWSGAVTPGARRKRTLLNRSDSFPRNCHYLYFLSLFFLLSFLILSFPFFFLSLVSLLGHGLSPFLVLFSTRNTRTARGYVRLAVGQHLMPRATRGAVSASERVSQGDQSHTIARRLGPNVRRATETDTTRATRCDAYYFFLLRLIRTQGRRIGTRLE